MANGAAGVSDRKLDFMNMWLVAAGRRVRGMKIELNKINSEISKMNAPSDQGGLPENLDELMEIFMSMK